MTKYATPPITEPKGVSHWVWFAACLGIIIIAAVMALIVPPLTTKIKQAITPPTNTAPAPQRTVPQVATVLQSRLGEWQSVTFGPEQVGMLVGVQNSGAVMCSDTQVPGSGQWRGFPSNLATNVDRYGNPRPTMTPRNPSYFRIEAPVTYAFLSSMDPTCKTW